jgi:hypothetical protein
MKEAADVCKLRPATPAHLHCHRAACSCILKFHCIPKSHCLNWLNFPLNLAEWSLRLRHRIQSEVSIFACILVSPSQPVLSPHCSQWTDAASVWVLLQLKHGPRRNMRIHCCEDCGNARNVALSHPVQCLCCLYHLLTLALRIGVVALRIISARQSCIMAPASACSSRVNKTPVCTFTLDSQCFWRKYISMSICVCGDGSFSPITVAARSKAWTVFTRWNTGIVGSDPTLRMDFCLRLFCVYALLCAGIGLPTGWSLVQGVLPIV